MARPFSGKPRKIHINLSVSAQTRAELQFVADHQHMSVSELVAMWAEKAAVKISKQSGMPYPDSDQMHL